MKDTARCLILIGFGALLGYGAFAIWPFSVFKPTTKDWVDALTALGTCAAVFAALGIAVWQQWQQRLVANTAARTTCVYMIPRAETLLASAKATLNALSGDADVLDSARWKAADGASHAMSWTPPPEQLVLLSPLPSESGEILTKAFSVANSLAFAIHRSGHLFADNMEDDFTKGLLRDWTQDVRLAIRLFEQSIKVMNSMTDSYRN
jgi:hypothetical protein